GTIGRGPPGRPASGWYSGRTGTSNGLLISTLAPIPEECGPADGSSALGVVHARVQGEPLVERAPGALLVAALEHPHDPLGRGQVDDGRVHVRVVEAPELQQDPIDPAHIADARLRLAEELDGIVVALAELEPTPMASLVLGRRLGLVGEHAAVYTASSAQPR